MESEIEVTVLMSVYHENRKQLKESIESILNQTYKEYEFLIINDGENEELIELINKYNDKRIIIENNNISVAELAEKCGFNSYSYFSKCFRRYIGILPSEYKKFNK